MEFSDLTIFDGILALVVLLSMFRGVRNGMMREVVQLMIWAGAFVAGFFFTPSLHPLMPEINILGDYADSCLIGSFLSFLSAFLIALIGFSVLATFITSRNSNTLGPMDVILGMLFGFARGIVLVTFAFVIYATLFGDTYDPEWLTEANSYDLLRLFADNLRDFMAENVSSWLGQQIEALTEHCRSPLGQFAFAW